MGLNLVKKVKVFKNKDGSYTPIADLSDQELIEKKEFIGNRIDQICHKLNKLEKELKYFHKKHDTYGNLWNDFIEECEKRSILPNRSKSIQGGSTDQQSNQTNAHRLNLGSANQKDRGERG